MVVLAEIKPLGGWGVDAEIIVAIYETCVEDDIGVVATVNIALKGAGTVYLHGEVYLLLCKSVTAKGA